MEKQEFKEAMVEAIREATSPSYPEPSCHPEPYVPQDDESFSFQIQKIANGFLVHPSGGLMGSSEIVFFPTKEEVKAYLCEKLKMGA